MPGTREFVSSAGMATSFVVPKWVDCLLSHAEESEISVGEQQVNKRKGGGGDVRTELKL